jgi:hypothetical protein
MMQYKLSKEVMKEDRTEGVSTPSRRPHLLQRPFRVGRKADPTIQSES